MTTPRPGSREAAQALADRLEAHTEQMANTSWGLTMQEWNVISNDILLAARTLRAALAPPADVAGEDGSVQVAYYRAKHREWQQMGPGDRYEQHDAIGVLFRALDAERARRMVDARKSPETIRWRNDGIEACAHIADRYQCEDAARDMRQLITKHKDTQDE